MAKINSYAKTIGLREVLSRTGLKSSELFELRAKNQFPAPLERHVRYLCWSEDEVHDWLLKQLENKKELHHEKSGQLTPRNNRIGN